MPQTRAFFFATFAEALRTLSPRAVRQHVVTLCKLGRLPTAGRQRAVLRTGSRLRLQSAIADATARRSVAYLSFFTARAVTAKYAKPR